MIPQMRNICPQCYNLRTLRLSQSRRQTLANKAKLLLKACHFGKAFIPAPLRVSSNKPVLRINSIILSVRTSCFITRLFKRKLDLPQSLGTVALAVRNRVQRSFQAKWSNQRQHLGRYCGIDPHVAECDTLRPPTMIYVGIVAQISCDTPQAIVMHPELASAVSAAKQSDQQATAIAHGARHPVDG